VARTAQDPTIHPVCLAPRPTRIFWFEVVRKLGDLVRESMGRSKRFSPQVRERAVRLVFEEAEHDSQWAAIGSIAAKIGCSAEALRKWVRRAERDQGRRVGTTSAERERLKELECENRELKRANEILRKTSAFFAQAELDRRPK
jgi:transposase